MDPSEAFPSIIQALAQPLFKSAANSTSTDFPDPHFGSTQCLFERAPARYGAHLLHSRTCTRRPMSSEKHFFTEEFPDHDYPCTTESSNPQTPLWPAYLPEDQDRIAVFERSKNAQLVVYSANFRDKKRRELDPKWPLDVNWQSFGWTDHPTSNSTGRIERKLAWGYSHKAVEPEKPVSGEAVGTSYAVTLNALPSRPSLLYVDAKGRVILQTTINGVASRLWKIYVKTNNSLAFVPKVLYVDLYGTNVDDDHATYERIPISS